ncbi:MAG: DnaJ C-terminal domain-containing protein [Pseudomonadota bacterium]
MAQDPYRVLGVAKSADAAAIKSAFRKLAKQHHPDTAGTDEKAKARAQAKFAEVNQAYEILRDGEKRARFDRGEIDADGTEKATFGGFGGFGGGPRGGRDPFGQGGPFADMGGGSRGGPNGGRGSSAEDILRQMFSGGGGGGFGNGFGGGFGGGGPSARRQAPAPETRAKVILTIADLLGSDKVSVETGGRKLAVSIPPGTRDGDVIRLRGQGQTDQYSQKSDLMLEIGLRPEKGWTVRGNDILGTFDAPLDVAVNGGKARATTPRGALALTVAPWTNGGKTFRLKGKGLPAKKGADGANGDMILTLNIALPDDQPEALATLLARLAES